jgi:endonuclease YncB( thermonuclease family)
MTQVLLLAWVFVSATDGDTMTVRDRSEHVRVRLAEVDPPERTQPYSQVW